MNIEDRGYQFGDGIYEVVHLYGGKYVDEELHLARLELQVALEEWHRRIPDYELQPGAELAYSPGIREIEHLPLRFPVVAAAVAAD